MQNLTYTIGLNSEEYGVGFRKGSDLAAALNDYFTTSLEDGSMEKVAETYGVQAALISSKFCLKRNETRIMAVHVGQRERKLHLLSCVNNTREIGEGFTWN